MFNDNTNICQNIIKFNINEYYPNENKTIYYSCNNSNYQDINNCKICSSKTNCSFCQDNFTFIDGNKSFCAKKEELKNKYIQDPFDESNYIKCGDIFNNCYTCNNTQCLSCKEKYIFINDDFFKCELKSSLDMNDYFTNDNITYYSCKDDRYKERLEFQKNNTISTSNYFKEYSTEIIINSSIANSFKAAIEISSNSQKNTITEYLSETFLNYTNIISIEDSTNTVSNSLINFTDKEIEINGSTFNPNYLTTEINSNYLDINYTKYSTEIIKSMTIINSPVYPIEALTYFSSIPYNINQFFQLFILQVRIINNLLKLYAIITIKIKGPLYISISIDLYKYNNLRILQDTQFKDYKVDLYSNEENEIEPGKICELISKERFPNSERIVVNLKENSEYEMKVLNNNNKILDSQENEKMIQNGEIVDFSKVSSELKVSQYNIKSSTPGCEFNLISEDIIEESKQSIMLNFTEKNNMNNRISAVCSLSEENNNKIPCSLNQNVNNNFTLDSYVGSYENRIFYITQDNSYKDLQLNCQFWNNRNFKTQSKNIIAVAVIFPIIFVIMIVVTIIIWKRYQLSKNENSPTKVINSSVNYHSSSEQQINDFK